MNSVFLQDLFSNVLLAIMVLVLLAIKLAGEPVGPPPPIPDCRLTDGTPDQAIITLAEKTDTGLGHIVEVIEMTRDRSTPVSRVATEKPHYASLLLDGCLRAQAICKSPTDLKPAFGVVTSDGNPLPGCSLVRLYGSI